MEERTLRIEAIFQAPGERYPGCQRIDHLTPARILDLLKIQFLQGRACLGITIQEQPTPPAIGQTEPYDFFQKAFRAIETNAGNTPGHVARCINLLEGLIYDYEHNGRHR